MKLSKADIYQRDSLRYRRIQELIQELDSWAKRKEITM